MTALSFDTIQWDTNNMFSLTNPTRLTARTAGKFQVSATVEFDASAVGKRSILLAKNATIFSATQDALPMTSGTTQLAVSSLFNLAVGDYIEVYVYQNSGGFLGVVSTDASSPLLAAALVQP